jgi:hypothetical protein
MWPVVRVVGWCFWNMVAEKGGSRGQAQQQCITTAWTCKRQQPSTSVQTSIYTRPIARFLVGNGRFKCPYVIRSEGQAPRPLQAAARAASRVPRQLCPVLLLQALAARWSRRKPVHGADRAMDGCFGRRVGASLSPVQSLCRCFAAADRVPGRAPSCTRPWHQEEVTLRELLVSHVKSP